MAAGLVFVSLPAHLITSRLHSLRPRFLTTGQFKNVILERHGQKKNVGVLKLNRPRAFNALNDALMTDLTAALQLLEQDKGIGCIVITGGERVFSVGADVPEMSQKTQQQVMGEDFPANFCAISKCRKPVIAAVNGYALGGGCEVAMMCDIIYAGDKAQFAQPEITLATIPGAGGTQRLISAVGKSRAMELVLTGDRLSALDAEQLGLVSKVFPAAQVLGAAVQTAEKIAGFSRIAAALCKEAVCASQELFLAQGLHFERRLCHESFSTNDQREGVTAFVNKREPHFTHD
ncbi:putative enoyl-CoA hydratase, mitochondrial [Babylonia areolata]|uniref:putative enoyl-CoA hydratase, mitochondrial n=1 Tax=Babylonia areolata TaxID=304850 RepID=UPI003FD15C34